MAVSDNRGWPKRLGSSRHCERKRSLPLIIDEPYFLVTLDTKDEKKLLYSFTILPCISPFLVLIL